MVVTLKDSTAPRRAPNRTDISDIRIVGVNHNVTALTGAHWITINPVDTAIFARAWGTDTGVILLCGVDAVGESVVGVDAIELRGELVVDGCPAITPVERDACTTIVAFNHALRVVWIDPQVVIIPVRRGDLREGMASIR